MIPASYFGMPDLHGVADTETAPLPPDSPAGDITAQLSIYNPISHGVDVVHATGDAAFIVSLVDVNLVNQNVRSIVINLPVNPT